MPKLYHVHIAGMTADHEPISMDDAIEEVMDCIEKEQEVRNLTSESRDSIGVLELEARDEEIEEVSKIPCVLRCEEANQALPPTDEIIGG